MVNFKRGVKMLHFWCFQWKYFVEVQCIKLVCEILKNRQYVLYLSQKGRVVHRHVYILCCILLRVMVIRRCFLIFLCFLLNLVLSRTTCPLKLTFLRYRTFPLWKSHDGKYWSQVTIISSLNNRKSAMF